MKMLNLFLLISVAATYSLYLRAQVSDSCAWSQAEEGKLVELAKTTQDPQINVACIEIANFFEAISNLKKVQSLAPQQSAILIVSANEKVQAARNIWVMAALKDEKFDENQLVTWGKILNEYKTKMNLYFAALDKKMMSKSIHLKNFLFLMLR